MVEVLLDKVDKAITVIETLKKVPEYNVELAVLQSFSCTRIKALEADPRIDDWALELENEPKALGKDNCMKEGLDIQPSPMLNIGMIELPKHFRTLAANPNRSSQLSQTNKGKRTYVGVSNVDKSPLRKQITVLSNNQRKRDSVLGRTR